MDKMTIAAFVVLARTLIGDATKRVALVWNYYRDEEYQPTGPVQPQIQYLGKGGLIRLAKQGYRELGLITFKDGDKYVTRNPQTEAEILEYVRLALGGDEDYIQVVMFTPKQYYAWKREELEKRCAPLAADICSRYNVKPNSLAFIGAVKRHYGRVVEKERRFRDDPEVRAERYACCMLNGNTSGFFEDNDYASSLISAAQDEQEVLMEYLYKYFPLLMARYEESKLRKR